MTGTDYTSGGARQGAPALQQRHLALLAAAWRGPGGIRAAEVAARESLIRLAAYEAARRVRSLEPVVGGPVAWLMAWATLPEANAWPLTAGAVEAWARADARPLADHWRRLEDEVQALTSDQLASFLALQATDMSSAPHRRGVHATPLDVADLLAAWTIRDEPVRVLDPACGAGVLLVRAAAWCIARRSGDVTVLQGVEADARLAALARLALASTGVRQAGVRMADFLALPAGREPVQVVVANPPFVRHEQVTGDTAARRRLRASAGLPGRADLHAYFWPALTARLAPGGRVAVVTPASWLEADYGSAVRRYVLDHYALEAVIEPTVERWFAGASIHTVLVLARRCTDAPVRAATGTRLVRLRRPLAELLGSPGPDRWERVAELVRRLDAVTRDEAGPDWQVRVTPASRLSGFGNADRLSSSTAIPDRWAPAGLLPDGERRRLSRPDGGLLPWGGWLRAPQVLLDLLTTYAARWRPLGQLARVRYPLKTGADSFFYLTAAAAEARGIEPFCLRPLVRTPRELATLSIKPDLLRWRVVTLPPVAVSQLPPGARRYVAEGEADGLARRPTCAARRPWYALTIPPPAALLWPRFIHQRHAVWLNQAGALENQTFYGVLAESAEAPLLAATLNSSLGALLMEVYGRSSLGDGALQYAVGQAARVPVPALHDAAASVRMALTEAMQALATSADWGMLTGDVPERAALDDLTLQLLGMTARDERARVAVAIRAGLNQLVAERQQRGDARAAYSVREFELPLT